jgi:deoxyadenosine/deoxycytidine kinase
VRSPARIEICGGIASGKTTLARLLARETQCALVLEDFRANPFWKRFYEHPEIFRHEKDVCFLAQHSGGIKNAEEPLVICDYAVIQDLAYAALSDSRQHLLVMQQLYQHLYGGIPKPTLIVHLLCNERDLLARIRARGRGEESSITTAYLAALNHKITEVLASSDTPILMVRSDAIDFAADQQAALELKNQLFTRLTEITA